MDINQLKEEAFKQVKETAYDYAKQELDEYFLSGTLFKGEIEIHSITDMMILEEIVSDEVIDAIQESVSEDEYEKIRTEIFELMESSFWECIGSEADKLSRIYKCQYDKKIITDEEDPEDKYMIYRFYK